MPRRREVEQGIERAAEALAAELGVELVDAAVRRRGGDGALVVTVDRAGGVTIDDCRRMNRALLNHPDVRALMDGPYSVEVESPGLDRTLRGDREFRHFRGREVEIRTYAPVDGARRFAGTLLGLEGGDVVLDCDDGGERRIPRERIAKARLRPDL